MSRLPDGLAHAYLEHLAVDTRPGDVDAAALAALVRSHVELLAWENLDVYRGRAPAIEPVPSIERLLAGRGGYCYHLNGAFASLLDWLDLDVTRHVSGVHGRGLAEPPGPNGNHLGITVRMTDGSEWLVDVGLGDGPAAPLPLAFGPYEHDGFTYVLTSSPFDRDGWRLEHDARGAFVAVDFSRAPATTADFLEMHRWLSTSPDSRFVKVVSISRRVEGGAVESLRGCVFSRVGPASVEQRDITTAAEWWGVVVDHFGLAYGDVPADERARLWDRLQAAHATWDAAGRP